MEPPPTPTVCMSIMGTFTGYPAMADSRVRGSSPSIRATSVEVPPMSKMISLWKPARLAMACAPTAPPAGPKRMVRTDSFMAVSAEMEPPLDCMMRSRFSPSYSAS